MANLQEQYQERYTQTLVPLAIRLKELLDDYLSEQPRIDRIVTRAKSIDRFITKAQKVENGKSKYNDPLNQIQDQVGARIVTFYKSDVEVISKLTMRYFRHIEQKNLVPESETEFGYFGKHFVMILPNDLFDEEISKEAAPKVFELQIKTLFQHAWAEANHDLGYKPERELLKDEKRQIAFTSAQAWGADMIFDQLYSQTPVVQKQGD